MKRRSRGTPQPSHRTAGPSQTKIAKLDRQADGYLDLVCDPEWPREKISRRLRQIRDERERLRRQLANAEGSEIDAGREAIEILHDLLTEPREVYRLASKRARRILNQAFFVRIYLDTGDAGPYVANDQFTEPVKRIHTLETATPAHSGRGWNNDGYVEGGRWRLVPLRRPTNRPCTRWSLGGVRDRRSNGGCPDPPSWWWASRVWS